MSLRIACRTALTALLCTLMLEGCTGLGSHQAPTGHLDTTAHAGTSVAAVPTPHSAPPHDTAATPAAAVTPAPPAARLEAPEKTYSVAVHNIPVAQLLLAIGRDAELNLDLHEGIEGRVTLNAIDQTLAQLLARVARQAPIRYEIVANLLSVRPDSPFVRSYALDYVNLSRTMRGTVATSTQIATSGSGADGRSNAAGNTSVTQIETRSNNDFWQSVLSNIRAVLADSSKAGPRCGTEDGTDCHDSDIMINRESGLVMVRATARQHEQLAAFIDAVQRASRRQVMIEATIVEVTLADGYKQGVDWTRLGLPGWNIRPRGSAGAGTPAPTLSYASGSTELKLELLETFGTVKVLSSPRLSVLNNQTAMLKVVEEYVYFLVDASTTQYGDSEREKVTATTTPQSVSVGMVMSVTPQISATGDITLNVRPTISGISGFKDDPNPSLRNIPNRVPQIRTREIESMLRLRSGEIAVLGGLMEDRIDHDTGRIPLLGDVPVLGELFTRRDNAVRRTELLIFLRPLLIEDPGIDGDYASYAAHLPGPEFLVSAPSPGQRNLPSVPLRPLLLPAQPGAGQ